MGTVQARLFKNGARGFSLVLHDPDPPTIVDVRRAGGSRYKNPEVKASKMPENERKTKIKQPMFLREVMAYGIRVDA